MVGHFKLLHMAEYQRIDDSGSAYSSIFWVQFVFIVFAKGMGTWLISTEWWQWTWRALWPAPSLPWSCCHLPGKGIEKVKLFWKHLKKGNMKKQSTRCYVQHWPHHPSNPEAAWCHCLGRGLCVVLHYHLPSFVEGICIIVMAALCPASTCIWKVCVAMGSMLCIMGGVVLPPTCIQEVWWPMVQCKVMSRSIGHSFQKLCGGRNFVGMYHKIQGSTWRCWCWCWNILENILWWEAVKNNKTAINETINMWRWNLHCCAATTCSPMA